MSNKIKTREQLKSEIRKARDRGEKIVTTNGCFDILHIGHLRCLQEAKELGDILVVAINSDDSVREIKGDGRPLVSEDERAEILAALECVDYVTIFPELDAIQLVRELRPDIHVKGGDYTLDQIVERETVESLGGEMRLMRFTARKSVTNLIKRVLENHGPRNQA